jgi:1-acyl-sn-glycerol-3-phosphate acyltransferase
LEKPTLFVPNHHGWFDGYLMYLVLTKADVPFLMWVEEFNAFPLFGAAGALPFPVGEPLMRARTIRSTLRQVVSGGTSLVLFAEGVLHAPPDVLPLGRSLEFLANKLPAVDVVPVAIHYSFDLHERPEATLVFGEPLRERQDIAGATRMALEGLLDQARRLDPRSLEVLFAGTRDVNERLGMRGLGRKRR